MNWKLKGMIQGGLSLIPYGSSCNYVLQRTVGSYRSDSRIDHTFTADVTVLFERMARLDLDPRRSRILEIGTGWLPIFPLSLALAGFRHTFTVDLYPHLRESAIRRTLLGLRKHLADPAFQHFASRAEVEANWQRLARSNAIFVDAGITYQAPCNAGATQWAAGSMDLIASNNVFEHVPPGGLVEIFAEGKRLLRPGGRVLHCINCGDHYAYADGGISQINYLRFSDQQWKRWNNDIQYQNRLRPTDFLEMADHSGLRIDSAEYAPNEAYLAQLRTMDIAPEFRHYPLEELASTSVTLVASA